MSLQSNYVRAKLRRVSLSILDESRHNLLYPVVYLREAVINYSTDKMSRQHGNLPPVRQTVFAHLYVTGRNNILVYMSRINTSSCIKCFWFHDLKASILVHLKFR